MTAPHRPRRLAPKVASKVPPIEFCSPGLPRQQVCAAIPSSSPPQIGERRRLEDAAAILSKSRLSAEALPRSSRAPRFVAERDGRGGTSTHFFALAHYIAMPPSSVYGGTAPGRTASASPITRPHTLSASPIPAGTAGHAASRLRGRRKCGPSAPAIMRPGESCDPATHTPPRLLHPCQRRATETHVLLPPTRRCNACVSPVKNGTPPAPVHRDDWSGQGLVSTLERLGHIGTTRWRQFGVAVRGQPGGPHGHGVCPKAVA